ncbi:Mpo1-like protein [Glaciecola petra]|uniref:Mpo1-like protein n=1 Tax=Glaciecola petra TaxID=3075602 RepID=A0ABU2ZS87_9ALTE|nr:Mpo1-like protein [Aestuariibacter sp. P117]MDT0595179.1 Mpo1-like protein [Aestuariibacter sp. P117]
MTFLQELQQQRWDDHRYYHHNRINQTLHLLSACCFVLSYVLVFINPVIAVLVGWLLAMTLRQTGHFFFEPQTYDEVNQATHDYKESVKVGYNLFRKVVLYAFFVGMPALLIISPDFFGLLTAHQDFYGIINNVAIVWLLVGIGAVLFRTIHLFFIMGIQSGLVWATKILTDPFHDIKIYHKAPYFWAKGEMYDDMSDWYEDTPQETVTHS